MNICVCMYIYVCMYVYMYIYVCVCVYIYVFMYMYVYIYITRGVGMWIAGLSFIAVQYIGEGGMIFLLRVCHLLFGNS